jgi:hypothetical protein
MSDQKTFVTTTQQKYINTFQLHLLMFHTFYTKWPIFTTREQEVTNVSLLPNDSIHYSSEQEVVQEVAFPRFFKKIGNNKQTSHKKQKKTL